MCSERDKTTAVVNRFHPPVAFNGKPESITGFGPVIQFTLFQSEFNQTGYYLEQKWGLDTEFVPEPSGCVLLGVGIAVGLLAFGRRKLR